MGRHPAAGRAVWHDLEPGYRLDHGPPWSIDMATAACSGEQRPGTPTTSGSTWLDDTGRVEGPAVAADSPSAGRAHLRVDHGGMEDPTGTTTRAPATARQAAHLVSEHLGDQRSAWGDPQPAGKPAMAWGDPERTDAVRYHAVGHAP